MKDLTTLNKKLTRYRNTAAIAEHKNDFKILKLSIQQIISIKRRVKALQEKSPEAVKAQLLQFCNSLDQKTY